MLANAKVSQFFGAFFLPTRMPEAEHRSSAALELAHEPIAIATATD
jgi:hypothetical protein